jgi:hypothetical protein
LPTAGRSDAFGQTDPVPGHLQRFRGIRIPHPRGLPQALRIARLSSLLRPTQLSRRTAVPLLRNGARRPRPILQLARDLFRRPHSLGQITRGRKAGIADMLIGRRPELAGLRRA